MQTIKYEEVENALKLWNKPTDGKIILHWEMIESGSEWFWKWHGNYKVKLDRWKERNANCIVDECEW